MPILDRYPPFPHQDIYSFTIHRQGMYMAYVFRIHNHLEVPGTKMDHDRIGVTVDDLHVMLTPFCDAILRLNLLQSKPIMQGQRV